MFNTINVMSSERCVLTLDYAAYHIFFCLLQYTVLKIGGRTKYFSIAHAFGLFALVMDYGLNYMTTGTRTLTMAHSSDESVGPLGSFIFFLWFDYSAFGLLVWALEVEDALREAFQPRPLRPQRAAATPRSMFTQSSLVVFSLFIVPFQFWTAPVLSQHLSVDPRTLVLTRSSNKMSYFIMVIVFPLLLKYFGSQSNINITGSSSSSSAAKIEAFHWKRDILPIWLAGFGCGLVHHAALFTFNMRGYTDPLSLAVTLLTEWPALILGVAVFRHLGHHLLLINRKNKGEIKTPLMRDVKEVVIKQDEEEERRRRSKERRIKSENEEKEREESIAVEVEREGEYGVHVFTRFMWVLFLGSILPHLMRIDDKQAMLYMMPYIPGQHMQSMGTLYLRARTCVAPQYVPSAVMNRLASSAPLNCWDDDDDDGDDDSIDHGSNSITGRKKGGKSGAAAAGGGGGRDMLIMAAAAKGGAVLSALIVAEVGSACNVCVASGERSAPGIPGPVEDLPVYKGHLLHAIINMRTWPQYVQERMGYKMNMNTELAASLTAAPTTCSSDEARNHSSSSGVESGDVVTAIDLCVPKFKSPTGLVGPNVRCVMLIREPQARLRSLYTYARSGGEHWFRFESGYMQALQNTSLTLQESIELFWKEFGQSYLAQSHDYMLMNLNLGCIPVQMELFKANFTLAAYTVLHTYGISDRAIPQLIERLASSADISRKSEAQMKADAHVTANKFSAALIAEVDTRFRETRAIADVIDAQRKELRRFGLSY